MRESRVIGKHWKALKEEERRATEESNGYLELYKEALDVFNPAMEYATSVVAEVRVFLPPCSSALLMIFAGFAAQQLSCEETSALGHEAMELGGAPVMEALRIFCRLLDGMGFDQL